MIDLHHISKRPRVRRPLRCRTPRRPDSYWWFATCSTKAHRSSLSVCVRVHLPVYVLVLYVDVTASTVVAVSVSYDADRGGSAGKLAQSRRDHSADSRFRQGPPRHRCTASGARRGYRSHGSPLNSILYEFFFFLDKVLKDCSITIWLQVEAGQLCTLPSVTTCQRS